MKSATSLLIALTLWAPAFVKAQSDASTPAQDWPKKVKLLQETRLDIQLGTVKASRKVPPNTEVDVLQVKLPNLVIRQNNATGTVPIATTDFFKRETNLIDIQGGVLPQESEQKGTKVAAFEIGKYEVTWDEWQKVRAWAVKNGYTDMRNVGSGSAGNHPVHEVSWYDVVKWCNARSEQFGLQPVYLHDGKVLRTGAATPTPNSQANGFRLPTKAEWEWAARGGIRSQGFIYSGSDDVNAVAWYESNTAVNPSGGAGTRPVGQKDGNELGIHDMSGNVREWCWDGNGETRRFRGGNWGGHWHYCRVANPGYDWHPFSRDWVMGFRLARNANP
jgi:formylglycine-generating enzyme